MDPLSDIVGLLRPTAAVSKPVSGRGRWGVRYAAHDAPGFTIVLKGRCWLAFADRPPLRLDEGDFLLLPTTPAFTLSSHQGLDGPLREPAATPVRHGDADGEPDFESLGGTFQVEPSNAPLLLGLLPDAILTPASAAQDSPLRRIIDLIASECATEAPGGRMMLERLLEILLIEALRRRDPASGDDQAGLLRGLRDPGLARALRAMHADVRAHWTVAGLAGVAGMSRSTFAARFGEALGCGPREYLIRWRLALARDALVRGDQTLDRIAETIGYDSASAFSTAFRKRLGCAPRRFAQNLALGKQA